MPSIPLISVVIPIYYCDESLFLVIESCLSSLRACYPWIDPILVDDASPLELPPHWDIAYSNPVNLGYTETVNRGLSLADGRVLVVANDDLKFHPGCLDRFMGLSGPAIASPADTSSSSDDRFGSCWGMTREAYELLGPLDGSLRHFYSDTDYYLRAKAAGIPVLKWHDVVLEHPESSTYKLVGKEELLEADRSAFEARHNGG